jgi:hypothetical protein
MSREGTGYSRGLADAPFGSVHSTVVSMPLSPGFFQ